MINIKKLKLFDTSFFIMLFIVSSISYGASSLDSGVKELAEKISKSMVENDRKKIAVIEFSSLDNSVNNLGLFIAEELITQLFSVNSKAYDIVERRQLAKVLRELKLTSSGLLDPEAMGKVGKILGIDAIVTGSLTDLDNSVKINARVISIESAKIISATSVNIPKVGTVATLLNSKSKQNSGTKLTHSKPMQNSESNYVFINKTLKVSFMKLKKDDKEITCVLSYTNIHDEPIRVDLYSPNTFLVDENGENWKYKSHTGIGGFIQPGKKMISKIVFVAEDDKDGKLFTFNEYLRIFSPKKDEVTVIFNDLSI